jgi:glutamyl-tRNA reductase
MQKMSPMLGHQRTDLVDLAMPRSIAREIRRERGFQL